MNCNQIKEKMWDELLNNNLSPQLKEHLEHCSDCSAEFEQLQEIIQTLKPKEKIRASENFTQNIIHKLKKEDKKMKKRVPFYLKVAAIFVLIATSFFLIVFTLNSPPQVSARPINQVLTESINKILNSNTMFIELYVRTVENDNFEYIEIEHKFVKHKIKVSFSPRKWIIEKPGRTVLFDGKNQYLDIKNMDEVIYAGPDAGFVEWFHILLSPDKILESEIERCAGEDSDYELHETGDRLILTTYYTTKATFTNDYLKNSSVSESDNRRVFIFDKETNKLLGFEFFIIDNQKRHICVMKTSKIKYNETFGAEEFSAKIFGKKPIVHIEDLMPKPDKDLINKTPEDIARMFFEGFAKENWEQVKKICPDCNYELKKMYGKLEIIEIGTSFKSGDYIGIFVPYTIKLKNGKIKKHNLAIRNDNPQKMWEIDGGY